MKRQLVVQDVVEILLHERHRVGETVLLVVSAVVHVGVITEEDTRLFTNVILRIKKTAADLLNTDRGKEDMQ